MSQEWQKLAIKTIGDDVAGTFASNVGIATMSEDFVNTNIDYDDQTQLDANWQPQGSDLRIRANFSTKVIDWDFRRATVPTPQNALVFDLFLHGKFDSPFGSLAAVGNWAMRWKMIFGSNLTAPSSTDSFGTVGLFDALAGNSDQVQSFIAYQFEMTTGGGRNIILATGNVSTVDTPTTQNFFTKQFSSDETLFFELKRTSSTTIEGTIYEDADYSVIIEKLKVTGIASAIDDMRFIRLMNQDNLTPQGVFNGTMDDVELFNESEGLQDFFTAKGNDKTPTFDIFPDLITGQNTPDFVADLFDGGSGWVDSGASEVFQSPLEGVITCLVDADSGQDGITNDVLGGTISDTAWVLRGSFNIADFLAGNSIDKTLFIGMWSTTQPPSASLDSIFFAIQTNSGLGDKHGEAFIGHSDGSLPQNATEIPFTYDVFNPMLEGRFFFELKRTSATTVECTIFDNRGFEFPLQTIFQTIPATVVDLRFISLQARIAAGTGRATIYFDSFEFFDGVTNACTFNTTPVLEQDTAQARMNYCNSSIFYSGIDDNTNDSISVDLGTVLADSGFVFRCKINVVDNNIVASSTPFHWIGLTSTNSVQNGSVSQEGIALRADPVTGNYNPSHGFGTDPQSGWTNEADYTDLTITNGEFFLEILRHSTTEVTMSIYNDELFNDLLQSRTFTIDAQVNDLRFFKIMNRQVAATTAFWEIIVTNIQIWDSIKDVDGFGEFRSLDVQTKANQLNGIIRAGYIFNARDESGDYEKITSLNNGGEVNVTTNRFLDVQGTPTAFDVYSFLVVFNRIGTSRTGNPFDKQCHGYDTVQANTFGPANVPDRTESVGMIKNFDATEQINKIQLRNDQAGIYDTDSEIVVFGTDGSSGPSPGMLVETGTFSKVVTPTTLQSVAVGFQPKALIIWGYRRATTDTDTAISASGSWGIVDDEDNNACVFWQDEDGNFLTQTSEGTNTTSSITFLDDLANLLVRSRATITLTPSGFDISWTTQDTVASRLHFIAYGGDDITGTQVRGFTLPSIVPPLTQSVTTDADTQNIVEGNGVLFIGSNVKGLGSIGSDIHSGIGMATKTTAEGCVGISARHARPTSEVKQVYSETNIIETVNTIGAALIWQAGFGGFTASGFDLDWIVNLIGFRGIYLIIKGGQWESGNEAARTTVGKKATTTTFEPNGLFTLSMLRTSEGFGIEDMNENIGAVDGLTNVSGGMTDEAGVFAVGTSNVGVMSSSTKVVRYNSPVNQAILTEAQLLSFNPTNFTLDWTTADGNPYKFLWLICG